MAFNRALGIPLFASPKGEMLQSIVIFKSVIIYLIVDATKTISLGSVTA
jgi:hypothetical protein